MNPMTSYVYRDPLLDWSFPDDLFRDTLPWSLYDEQFLVIDKLDELGSLAAREQPKESLFGSREQVDKINACYHEWVPRPATLFGYMDVEAHCRKCGTWYAQDVSE